jgi:anaerobic magnesium-protoporphyrin IX monomethyl ester cyclase
MVTVRGCSHHCTFCPTQIWNKGAVRPRDLDLVMDEIDELVGRYGIREINIRDDTFTWSRQRVTEFCEALVRRGHDLTWRCFATASTVDADLFQLMAAAGCTQVCFGFESGDDAILSQTGKGTTVEQGRQATHWAKAAGLEVSGTFIVGLEGDTRASIDRSIAFAIDNELDYIQVNVAAPMPTTGFGKRQERAGRSANPDAFRWSGRGTSETQALSATDLPHEARRFYRKFYLRPKYVQSRLTSHRNLVSMMMQARLGVKMVRYALTGR